MNEKNQRWFWVHGILLLVLLVALVRIVIASRGLLFSLEMIGLLFLVVLSVASMGWYHSSRARWTLFTIFVAYAINLVLLWLVQGKAYVVLLVLAVVGIFISLPHQRKADKVSKSKSSTETKPAAEEPHSVVFDSAKSTASASEAKKAAVTFSPGKYVASKNSNVYHKPTCDWAKKIAKSRQVWFADKKEAWAKGYKKHSCL
ncbi:hypothetical protein HYU22_02585 [Candidatus Woesearchaeota archaeon]|nr:hypothetical protein [Candidatus Woesearchaeota archaeon]